MGWKTSNNIDYTKLYNLYCFQNRTYTQLAEQYWKSVKTIQKWLDLAVYKKRNAKVFMSDNYRYDIFLKKICVYGI